MNLYGEEDKPMTEAYITKCCQKKVEWIEYLVNHGYCDE